MLYKHKQLCPRGGNILDVIISNNSEVPIYRQLKEQIKEAVLSGALKEGDILPSIRSLANETRVSVLTTRRAYEELEQEGFIKTVHGKGSFVASKSADFLREARLKEVEQKLTEAYEAGRTVGVKRQEMHDMMDILYESGDE